MDGDSGRDSQWHESTRRTSGVREGHNVHCATSAIRYELEEEVPDCGQVNKLDTMSMWQRNRHTQAAFQTGCL